MSDKCLEFLWSYSLVSADKSRLRDQPPLRAVGCQCLSRISLVSVLSPLPRSLHHSASCPILPLRMLCSLAVTVLWVELVRRSINTTSDVCSSLLKGKRVLLLSCQSDSSNASNASNIITGRECCCDKTHAFLCSEAWARTLENLELHLYRGPLTFLWMYKPRQSVNSFWESRVPSTAKSTESLPGTHTNTFHIKISRIGSHLGTGMKTLHQKLCTLPHLNPTY